MRLPLFPESASTISGQVDALYFFLIGVTGFFAVLVATLVVAFGIRYRRRAPEQVGVPIHGSVTLEIVWTAIPFCLAMVMFFWGARVYMTMARAPENAMEIFVVGKQWMWKIQHREGRREINELHIPIGQPVKLTLTSEDVIHSFYVPAFRNKMDAVPGRYTSEWFEATKVGEYHLFCAEYCGTAHSRMIGRVVVMEPNEYQAWLNSDSTTTGVAVDRTVGGMTTAGEELFNQKGCATCHLKAPGGLGPVLAGVFGKPRQLQGGGVVTADDNYLRESILNPQAKIVEGYQPVMPTFQGQLDEQQVLQLLQYIKSLSEPVQTSALGERKDG